MPRSSEIPFGSEPSNQQERFWQGILYALDNEEVYPRRYFDNKDDLQYERFTLAAVVAVFPVIGGKCFVVYSQAGKREDFLWKMIDLTLPEDQIEEIQEESANRFLETSQASALEDDSLPLALVLFVDIPDYQKGVPCSFHYQDQIPPIFAFRMLKILSATELTVCVNRRIAEIIGEKFIL